MGMEQIWKGLFKMLKVKDLTLQPGRPKVVVPVIGTSPESVSISTHIPGDHGGNMDCTKISEGTTLYLPVFVPGALLSMGDLHAVMGDGCVTFVHVRNGFTAVQRSARPQIILRQSFRHHVDAFSL